MGGSFPEFSLSLLVSLAGGTEMNETFEINRHYMDGRSETIATGLTRKEAQEHCSDPETSSKTCTSAEGIRRTEEHGDWFDGFEQE
jgi:hypothetical protein